MQSNQIAAFTNHDIPRIITSALVVSTDEKTPSDSTYESWFRLSFGSSIEEQYASLSLPRPSRVDVSPCRIPGFSTNYHEPAELAVVQAKQQLGAIV